MLSWRGVSTGACIGLVLLGVFGSGCALQGSSRSVVKECVLPTDQTATLMGHWRVAPVPIAFHSAFGDEYVSEMIAAADTWNKFFKASVGVEVFNYGDKMAPNRSSANKPAGSAQLCSQVQGILLQNSSQFSGAAVIYPVTNWTSASHKVIALTSACPLKATPYNYFSNGMIEVNYQDYFAEGRQQPDLKTIIVHELGHLLGLDHSCNPTNRKGFPMCGSNTLPSDYRQAVMFPSFGFDQYGSGEVRDTLNDNDEGRANCLYKTSTE